VGLCPTAEYCLSVGTSQALLQGWLLSVGFCVPCHVLKIAWGRVGKVMGDCICAGCSIG